MNQDIREYKKFLEQQLQWSKNQDRILEEIDKKLHDMKSIAEYSLEHTLTSLEIEKLNVQINELKNEIHSLEKQLYSPVH